MEDKPSKYRYFKIIAIRVMRRKSFVIILFFLGIAIGLFLHKLNIFKEKPHKYIELKRLYPEDGRLVNPLMGVENPEGGDAKLEEIKYAVSEYISRCKANGDVSNISLYLMQLNTGSWIGINGRYNYAAASLVKVPLLILYLRMAEKDPLVLKKEIKYDVPINSMPQNVTPGKAIQPGNTYTIDELLRYMIVYSDNGAKDLLLGNIDIKLIADVYSDLKLATPDFTEQEHEVSTKDYAAFFRVLYNATYLNKESCEKALEFLTDTEFRDGIVAGVPGEITIAHKFAERKYTSEVYSLKGAQLHDCGIVYYPKNPYLICVMTRGNDLNVLKGIIKNISKIVYEHEAENMGLY
jgi:beta-lactamase class A